MTNIFLIIELEDFFNLSNWQTHSTQNEENRNVTDFS